MRERARLPNRRGAEFVDFEHNGGKWTATFGRLPDGRLGEIFLNAQKDSPLVGRAQESALAASIAMQHGAELRTLRHTLRGRDSGPLAAALGLIDGETAR